MTNLMRPRAYRNNQVNNHQVYTMSFVNASSVQFLLSRDLKCENVLLDENELIKVTDFGFATRYPTSKCKFLDTFCGSYAYAAPEILSACKYDGKLADIWSL